MTLISSKQASTIACVRFYRCRACGACARGNLARASNSLVLVLLVLGVAAALLLLVVVLA
ncbi:hypothetical protein PC116_g5742 [Phytophthora cactorum]|uniref:Uncharacterized protein n=1 Tax=Phytophthora cactorum TaxID=29920 RepID=A0A8T1LAD8_9STRA|nr:hypothetical protein PC114_g13533 [Phytophthora cactorum]KAG2937643.1 hypothetical protein PC117_g11597 [Phytophthora cactorum]KAG4246504.1 hypothetical protein PC116_g5742 [Phytophthora cactorum]